MTRRCCVVLILALIVSVYGSPQTKPPSVAMVADCASALEVGQRGHNLDLTVFLPSRASNSSPGRSSTTSQFDHIFAKAFTPDNGWSITVWDGTNFVWSGDVDSWGNWIWARWRYGSSLSQYHEIVSEVNKLVAEFSVSKYSFQKANANDKRLKDLIATPASTYLLRHGLSRLFIDEIIATKVFGLTGANLNEVSAFSAIVLSRLGSGLTSAPYSMDQCLVKLKALPNVRIADAPSWVDLAYEVEEEEFMSWDQEIVKYGPTRSSSKYLIKIKGHPEPMKFDAMILLDHGVSYFPGGSQRRTATEICGTRVNGRLNHFAFAAATPEDVVERLIISKGNNSLQLAYCDKTEECTLVSRLPLGPKILSNVLERGYSIKEEQCFASRFNNRWSLESIEPHKNLFLLDHLDFMEANSASNAVWSRIVSIIEHNVAST